MTGGMEIYENSGGRPSEGMCQVGGLTVLERDSSPVDPEDQRLAKKGRNEDGSKETFGDSRDLKDMDAIYEEDAGVSRGESKGVSNATKNPDLNDTSRFTPAISYAAVTAKNGSVNNERGEDAHSEPDEVSKIRAGFNGSGSGSRFEVLQDDTPADSPILVPLDRVVVEEGSGRGLDLGDRNEVSGLRGVDQQPWITKNAAYLESNPSRKVLETIMRFQLLNRGFLVGMGSRMRGGFSGGSGSRVGKENVFKGLRIRKNVEAKDHGTAVLSNWVHQGAAHGVVDMVEDDPGDVLMHEQTNDLFVLGSTVDTILSQRGGVNVP
ncbi:hypothetical protein V6N12_025705 [Hibiscus sabdariffa]|uniref:Uncharacterized protein n=1 Tax=Hibiscus sabdariffa TaxID=183260 RepID=A0ABR2ASX9_9ROSI